MGARERRDNLRRTWVPTGKELQRLEEERGVVIRFVIGYRWGAAGCFAAVRSTGGKGALLQPAGSCGPAGQGLHLPMQAAAHRLLLQA